MESVLSASAADDSPESLNNVLASGSPDDVTSNAGGVGDFSDPGVRRLPAAHGPRGTLVDLLTSGSNFVQLRAEARTLPYITLTDRQVCDLEMLLNGGFSPLQGFMVEADYRRVLDEMRLADGTLWPMPVLLDVSEQEAKRHALGSRLVLESGERHALAVLTVESIFGAPAEVEAVRVLGRCDVAHPTVAALLATEKQLVRRVCLGGRVAGLMLPVHYDFCALRLTPTDLRRTFARMGWARVVAFQTRNPMHRSHRELTLRASRDAKANLLVQPVVGLTKPGDVDHYTRVRCYQALLQHYPPGMALLSLLPLAMRMAGPREALWHAIIRKNYGCTHFIIGRDHAGPGDDSTGKPFYGPYEAHQLVQRYESELGIGVLFYQQVVFVEELGDYMQENEVPAGMRALTISGTELRRRLYRGIDIPTWFTYSEVVRLLRQTHPPRYKQGFTVFFTGLSGSGKSTMANALRIALLEEGSRPVTLLDGDEVRTHLSTTLGFSKEHRNLNVRRIGFVASQITKAHGIAICAAIAPYDESRNDVRKLVSAEGGFFEVYVSTPLAVCEARDRKGLYARARAGLVKGFTGVDDPYDTPSKPELIINSAEHSVTSAIQLILLQLEQEGYIVAGAERH